MDSVLDCASFSSLPVCADECGGAGAAVADGSEARVLGEEPRRPRQAALHGPEGGRVDLGRTLDAGHVQTEGSSIEGVTNLGILDPPLLFSAFGADLLDMAALFLPSAEVLYGLSLTLLAGSSRLASSSSV